VACGGVFLRKRRANRFKGKGGADRWRAAEGAIVDESSDGDGAAMEGAMIDVLSDEDGARRKNRLPTRQRSDGDVSIGGGGSSEGSMPSSSYERDEISNR
jgi:hypothetical protein